MSARISIDCKGERVVVVQSFSISARFLGGHRASFGSSMIQWVSSTIFHVNVYQIKRTLQFRRVWNHKWDHHDLPSKFVKQQKIKVRRRDDTLTMTFIGGAGIIHNLSENGSSRICTRGAFFRRSDNRLREKGFQAVSSAAEVSSSRAGL